MIKWLESVGGASEDILAVSGMDTGLFGEDMSNSSESLSSNTLLLGMRLVRDSDEEVKS